MTIYEQFDQSIAVIVSSVRPQLNLMDTVPRVVCMMLEKAPDGYDLVGVSRNVQGSSQIILQPLFIENERLNLAEWDTDVKAWKIPFLEDDGKDGVKATDVVEWFVPLQAQRFLVGE